MQTHENYTSDIFLCSTVSFGRGGLVLGQPTDDMVEQYLPFFQCFTVSISGELERFVPMGMVVETRDPTDVESYSNISALQSIPLCYTVCHLLKNVVNTCGS
jgi:hypothetical protein